MYGNLPSDPSEAAPACECVPDCLDIATGVLTERHGLAPHDARLTVLGSAERQSTSVHAVARQLIEAVVEDRPAF